MIVRQILWTILFSLVGICMLLWGSLYVQPLLTKHFTSNLPNQIDNLDSQDLLRKQIYTQTKNALRLQNFGRLNVVLLPNSSLRITKYENFSNKTPHSLQKALAEIVPNYLKTLSQPHFSNKIDKIHIESHTSSQWGNVLDLQQRYNRNKILSDQRARAVETYIYQLENLKYLHPWMELKLAPVGRSFQQRIYKNGKENVGLSNRIEIRIVYK